MVLVARGAGFIRPKFVFSTIAETAESVVNLGPLTYACKLENVDSLSSI
jgi:dTDP-D-glucose 4,6-dehydratase